MSLTILVEQKTVDFVRIKLIGNKKDIQSVQYYNTLGDRKSY